MTVWVSLFFGVSLAQPRNVQTRCEGQKYEKKKLEEKTNTIAIKYEIFIVSGKKTNFVNMHKSISYNVQEKKRQRKCLRRNNLHVTYKYMST